MGRPDLEADDHIGDLELHAGLGLQLLERPVDEVAVQEEVGEAEEDHDGHQAQGRRTDSAVRVCLGTVRQVGGNGGVRLRGACRGNPTHAGSWTEAQRHSPIGHQRANRS